MSGYSDTNYTFPFQKAEVEHTKKRSDQSWNPAGQTPHSAALCPTSVGVTLTPEGLGSPVSPTLLPVVAHTPLHGCSFPGQTPRVLELAAFWDFHYKLGFTLQLHAVVSQGLLGLCPSVTLTQTSTALCSGILHDCKVSITWAELPDSAARLSHLKNHSCTGASACWFWNGKPLDSCTEQLGMVEHVFNPTPLKTEAGSPYVFEASLIYIGSSRPARATKWGTILRGKSGFQATKLENHWSNVVNSRTHLNLLSDPLASTGVALAAFRKELPGWGPQDWEWKSILLGAQRSLGSQIALGEPGMFQGKRSITRFLPRRLGMEVAKA
jgi:hypothetical protein